MNWVIIGIVLYALIGGIVIYFLHERDKKDDDHDPGQD